MQYRPTADYLLAYNSVIRSSVASEESATTPPDPGKLLKEFIDAVHALNMTVLVQIPIQDQDQKWLDKEVTNMQLVTIDYKSRDFNEQQLN